MLCLGNRDHSVIFETVTKFCILDCFVDYEGYSITPKGFLLTVVDIMVIWVKFIHSSPFKFTESDNIDVHCCHLLFEHFQFTLIHGPNIAYSYAILFLTASDLPSITSHIHSWESFWLWLQLFTVSGVISPLLFSSILCTYWPKEFIFQCHIFLPFHTVHGTLKERRRRKWQPAPIFLPKESHGQRSLEGYSPLGCKESDTTEWLNWTELSFTLGQSSGGTRLFRNSLVTVYQQLGRGFPEEQLKRPQCLEWEDTQGVAI